MSGAGLSWYFAAVQTSEPGWLSQPHSFQVCGSVFTVGRRRLRPAVARLSVAR